MRPADEPHVYDGANCMLVLKANGDAELIQFAYAMLNSDSSYTLYHLLRGRRNTEYAATGHGGNETVILLPAAAKDGRNSALHGRRGPVVQRRDGGYGTISTSQEFVVEANDLRPAAPVHVTTVLDGSKLRYLQSWIDQLRWQPV